MSDPISQDTLVEVLASIRPAVQSDDGDITLVDVDVASGVVTLKLVGSCGSCPSSTGSMKAGIERILKDRVPGLQSVTQLDGEGGHSETPVSL